MKPRINRSHPLNSKNCRRGQLSKFTSIVSNANYKHVYLCMLSLISFMHHRLMQAVGCATDLIKL